MPQLVRFLYWNTGNKAGTPATGDTREQVLAAAIARSHPPDLLILGECSQPLSPAFLSQHQLLELTLNKTRREELRQRIYYRSAAGFHLTHLHSHLEILGPKLPNQFPPPKQLARVVLLRLEVKQQASLLACVHLPSHRQGHQDETSLHDAATRYKSYIIEAAGHPQADFSNRIAVLGDFNMNPYDTGMLQPISFFALNNQKYVRHTRKFVETPEVMFYNPCWALLSDYDPANPTTPRPSGSVYYKGTPSKKLYWHLFDQVIVSKAMIPHFVPQELRIVPYAKLQAEVESNTLRSQAVYSDHLPLQFTLTF